MKTRSQTGCHERRSFTEDTSKTTCGGKRSALVVGLGLVFATGDIVERKNKSVDRRNRGASMLFMVSIKALADMKGSMDHNAYKEGCKHESR